MKNIFIGLTFLTVFNLNAQVILSNDTIACGSFIDTLQAISSDLSSIQSDDSHVVWFLLVLLLVFMVNLTIK
jgi:hypothetical protein